jgi:23S rRNA (guanosine2251-2'-O)-methyltransferase
MGFRHRGNAIFAEEKVPPPGRFESMPMDRKLLNIELGRISAERYGTLPDWGVAVVLDNVRSAYNVGSVFRTCDAFKVDRLYLCGICACPPSAEIHKTALGAESSVGWEHCDETLPLVERLRAEGYTVVSVEQTVHARKLDAFKPEAGKKYALIFGNEVDGVDQAVVDASDMSLEIPQFGTKHSLNVSVSAGVVLWHFRLLRGA